MKFSKWLLIVLMGLCFCPLCFANISTVREGDTLVYRVQDEDQNAEGNAEVLNASGEKVRVLRTTSHRSEKILLPDDGLKYGHTLKVGMKLNQDPPRDDNMYCDYVESKEDVTVPAGTFIGCFKVTNYNVPDHLSEWYCPGVGVVKSELLHHGGTIANRWTELEKIIRDKKGEEK